MKFRENLNREVSRNFVVSVYRIQISLLGRRKSGEKEAYGADHW
jgi:hypothetical protein